MKTEYKVEVDVPMHVLLTIRRPNGEVEKVKVTPGGFKTINDKIFSQIVAATKTAGRGEVLSYENIKKTEIKILKLTEADIAGIESDNIAKMMAYGE